MKVTTATHRIEVQPDHVYVIPPNADIALEGNSLLLSAREDSRKPHLAIDFFFPTLATQPRGQAIGVLLSGSGSYGTQGLPPITTKGGITFAHDTHTQH